MSCDHYSRRNWLRLSSFSVGSVAASWLLKQDGLLASTALEKPSLEPEIHDLLPRRPHHEPKAQAMISMWMYGGPSQIDLFDYKPELVKRNGQQFDGKIKWDNAAQASREIMGPLWGFKHYGECGMHLSEKVPHLGSIADEITLIRSMKTGSNNHVPSTRSMTTGAPVNGRPVLGSWLVQALGSESQDLPAFVALTDPRGLPQQGNENWSQGKLPSIYQGTMVRSTEPRIFNLDSPAHLRGDPRRAQLDLLEKLNREHANRHPGENELEARLASYGLAARMQGAAKEAFDISKESESTKRMYGIDQDKTRNYGTRCLIARRLIERGVRFVQVYSDGEWDAHSDLNGNHRGHCRATDKPIHALLTDLKRTGLMDDTLVIWGGEFGRMPVSQGNGGRDHNPQGFGMFMTGAGIKPGVRYGELDEIGYKAAVNRVSVHDLHATMLHLLGLDHERLTYFHNGRRFRLTDVAGEIIRPILV